MSRQRRSLAWSLSAVALGALVALLTTQCRGQIPQAVADFAVENDGDSVVLIPKDPTTAYLVFALAPDSAAQEMAPGAMALVPTEKGMIRLPAKGLDFGMVLEIRAVARLQTAAGYGLVVNPCKPETCDYPLPPCWPNCSGLAAYLAQPAEPRVIDLQKKP